MSRGVPPIIVRDVNSGADGSPGLTGDSLDDPECTSTAASAVTSIWKKNEAASTQRLRSPKVRWKKEIRAAPSRKERIAVRDLSQAKEGVSTGSEFAPRARKIVFPVWLLEVSTLGFEDGMESFWIDWTTYLHRHETRICIVRPAVHEPGDEKVDHQDEIGPSRRDICHQI